MLGSLEDVLGALERLSAEMARPDGPPLPELTQMIARRQALVERIAAFQPLDAALAVRLDGIARLGVVAGDRLDAARESLRQEIEEMERVRRFSEGLGHTVPDRAPRLNARG
ncbi:MAG: hypothetical protein WDO73_17065 [Ignavibacteriota bacterium]